MTVEDEYFLADELDRALRAAGATVLGPAPLVEAALNLMTTDKPLDFAAIDVNLVGEMAYLIADALLVYGHPGQKQAFDA